MNLKLLSIDLYPRLVSLTTDIRLIQSFKDHLKAIYYDVELRFEQFEEYVIRRRLAREQILIYSGHNQGHKNMIIGIVSSWFRETLRDAVETDRVER
jgi:hypothetical protein